MSESPEIKPTKTLGEHFAAALRKSRGSRPASFYLLFAIVAVLLLGGQIYFIQDDPKQFAFFLSLYFIFFFVVIFRAILDVFDIARQHIRERERVFSSTIGDPEFAEELGRSVAKKHQN